MKCNDDEANTYLEEWQGRKTPEGALDERGLIRL